MTPIIIPEIVTKKQCKEIIKLQSSWNKSIGTIGAVENENIDYTIRQCMIYEAESAKQIPTWLGTAIATSISHVNDEVYKFDLIGELELKLMRYNSAKKDHYKPHIDIGAEGIALRRKISFTLILNDSYEGGRLRFHGMEEMSDMLNLKIGDMIIFPSYMTHEVEPVISGIRWALVGWLLGEKHFV